MEIASLKIDGLTGDCCATKVQEAITALEGVDRARVSLASKHASVSFDPTKVNAVMMKEAVRAAGYDVLPAHGEEGNCCGGCGGS